MESIKLEISYRTIFKAFFAVLAIVFLFYIRQIVLALFAAFVISAIVNPLVDWLESKKIKRVLANFLAFAGLIVFLIFLFYWILPPLAAELGSLGKNFPQYIDENISKYPFLERFNLKDNFNKAIIDTANLVKSQGLDLFVSTISIFGGLFYVFFALVAAYYLTEEKNLVSNYLKKITVSENHENIGQILHEIEAKMGGWFWGQVILSVISGTAIFLGLTILSVPFAPFLAILAAVLRFIPYLGGLISDGIGVLIAFLISPSLGVAAFLMYYIIQQIEGYFIIPRVMRKTIGLNPIAVITAVVIGEQLGGIAGALFALPATMVLVILMKEFILKENKA